MDAGCRPGSTRKALEKSRYITVYDEEYCAGTIAAMSVSDNPFFEMQGLTSVREWRAPLGLPLVRPGRPQLPSAEKKTLRVPQLLCLAFRPAVSPEKQGKQAAVLFPGRESLCSGPLTNAQLAAWQF